MAERTRSKGAGSAKKGDAEPFEVMLERLEGLVERLEDGELSLEASLEAYEEGVGLVRRAQTRLDTLDRRLEQLLEGGRTAPLGLPDGVGDEVDDDSQADEEPVG